ncbi:MAG: hypothetical protein KDD11_15425, partial [Acidobacteria bacterium]|nr:hypothetical protein [Acidobacteriota bacterium]
MHHASAASPGTRRVPTTAAGQELAAICRSLEAGDNRYFGRRPEEQLRQRLATGGLPPAAELEARRALGRELLELGKPADAIVELEAALDLARGSGAAQEVVLDLIALQGLAHLQAAEDTNCISMHTAASCILPILPEGVHRQPEHARKAGDLFLAFLEQIPRSLQTAWLLDLSRMISGDYPEGVPEPYRLPPGRFAEDASARRWIDRGV